MSQLLKQKNSPDVSVTGGVDSGCTEPFFQTEFSQFPIAPRDQCGEKEDDPIKLEEAV